MVWPSVNWTAHYADCPDGRRCRHHTVFPNWWLDMVSRGIPYDSDADTALQHAAGRVNRYRGHPPLQPEPLLFAQQVVLDSLVVAPAPITESWVMGSLAAVGGLARWVHGLGQPLTRDHALGEATRYRWISGAGHLTAESASIYAVRLELIADHLNGVSIKRLPRATKATEAPVEPLTPTEQADLWAWARGLRPRTRRERVQGHILLGLGFGLTRNEKYRITTDHVFTDADGVHVAVTDPDGALIRFVTCRRDWEDHLLRYVATVQHGGYLVAPWRLDPPPGSAVDESLRRAHKWAPPVEFNNVRLRNTWLCEHLADGTPLKILMAAAGVAEANHLHKLLTLLPTPNSAAAAAALRGPERGAAR
ncbi:hypothetical protein [Nocardioides sp. OK12]|uniref:hypothetical protein n=1 Tax=Nocardioides sp. OK12 TaxID=2758661 RepID=UPI0021C2974F|nr:hypothetical protein [Nocardioides sp. OK12]